MKNILLPILLLISLAVTSQTTVVDSFYTGGYERSFRIFLPTGFSTNESLPLVFNFHGLGSNAIEQELYTQFDNVADTGNFIVCHPEGINNSWNLFGSAPDDVAFVDTLIDVLHSRYNINLNRVYSTGLSNGGFMSNLLGCALSNRIAAIAPVAGTTAGLSLICNPLHPVPVLYIHGTADPVVNYNGAPGFTSVNDLMTLWAAKNGCTSVTDTVDIPDSNPLDLCTAQKITWHDCDNSELIHYRIIGGGHTWPGAPIPIGVTNQDFNASGIIWNFFNKYSLPIGINEISKEVNYSIFPNPSSSIINIESITEQAEQLNVFSIDGKKIVTSALENERVQINSGNWQSGVYIFQFNYKDKNTYLKFLKD